MQVAKFRELEEFVCAIFVGAGATKQNAEKVAKHLVESNLAGHDSHGVMRVAQYVRAIRSAELDPTAEPRIVQEFLSGAVLDGCSAFGQVAAQAAMQLAMEKARKAGIGAVTVRNCYHSGRIAAYTEAAARDEMIGIVMVNAGGGGQSVAPFGGSKRRLATNPISISSPPCEPYPLVLDIASSVAPEGKIREYMQRGAKLPDGWIVDAKGRSSTDPSDFYGPPGGSLLPFGGQAGYKGFGLAFMIDILAGALSGAGCCSEETVAASDGILTIAVDASHFGALESFHRHVLRLIEHIKSCPPAPGFEEVYVPGEVEYRAAEWRRASGVPIPDSVWSVMRSIAEDLGLTAPVCVAVDGHRPSPHFDATSQQTPSTL